jgi:hypothetical protein
MIDKKIKEVNISMKINFYERMDQETIPEKKEKNNEDSSLLDKFKAMFCAGPSPFDLMM